MKNDEMLAIINKIYEAEKTDNMEMLLTPHGNSYAVCLRVSHLSHLGNVVPHKEYSLPETTRVYGIGGKNHVTKKVTALIDTVKAYA